MRHWKLFPLPLLLLLLPLTAVFAVERHHDSDVPSWYQTDPETTPEPIIVPEATEEPTSSANPASAVDLLLPARIDLELLANELIGINRPEGWSGSVDVNDPQLAILIRLDLEILTGVMLGDVERPAGWFGAVPSTGYAIARDIRHDLELLVDALGIEPPAGWTGAEPLLSCDRSTQALITVLEQGGIFTLQADRTAPDFCQQATIEASTFVEINLLGDPGTAGAFNTTALANAGDPQVAQENAVAFLDLAATLRGGVLPIGERLEPVARDPNSELMMVRGIGFELFVDYRFTNVSQDAFNALPTVGSVRVAPRCDADWCG